MNELMFRVANNAGSSVSGPSIIPIGVFELDEAQKHRRQILRTQLANMHVQWFAAEDEGRTEDPTEHKIKKAREEGRVARSPDLSGAIILLVTVVALAILGGWFMTSLADMLRFFLQQATTMDPTRDKTIGTAFFSYMLKLSLPICLIAMVAGIAGELIQVGFLFTTKPLKPDFKRIMPKLGQYFKRSFGSVEAFYNLAKAIFKIGILIGIAWINIAGNIDKLLNLPKRTYLEGFGYIAQLTFSVMVQSAVVLLLMALFDFWFQRRQFRDSLKMTKQEIKEERKTYDGDPLIKSRLRQRMREILSQNMIRAVPQADVVVTNPTHYAIALEYKRESMQAPTVIAKGQDLLAQRIKEIAREHSVPIIENKPLARALYAEVEVGDTIPEHFYEAVVVVLKQVYRMKRKEREAV